MMLTGKSWLLPYKFCISNKIKEIHFNILHKIYPCNAMLSKFMDIDSKCVFCDVEESIAHVFCECNVVQEFWMDLRNHLSNFLSVSYLFTKKDVLCYFTHCNKSVEFVTNFLILSCKFFIHKHRFLKAKPKFKVFLLEFNYLLKSLRIVKDKKNELFLQYYDSLMNV